MGKKEERNKKSEDDAVQVDEISSTTVVKKSKKKKENVKSEPSESETAEVKEEIKVEQNVGVVKKEEKKLGRLIADPAFLKGGVEPRAKALVKHGGPSEKWFEYQFNEYTDQDGEAEKTSGEKGKFMGYARLLMRRDDEIYQREKSNRKGGETSFLHTAASGGTAGDRLAALTLLCQESPVHSLESIEGFADKVRKSRHEALDSLDTVRDLFIENLLPESRKLIPMDKRPLLRVEALSSGTKDARDKRILMWFFEDQLREKYQELIREIQKLCHDTVEATRIKATRILLELLEARPEQEQFLLSSVVNKLGDTNYKVAAKVSNMILHLLNKHPNMMPIVVTEIERLLYRPNISQRAQFYGICTLSQIALRASDSAVAKQLLHIYFSLFRLLVKKEEIDNRMLTVILSGTNRAFPYAKGTADTLDISDWKDLDTLYKVAGKAHLGTALQTLSLLLQILDSGEGVSDRYYTALYRRLRDPNLPASAAKHSRFFNLLFRSLKSDPIEKRIQAFLKRILQLALSGSPSFAAGCLLLVGALANEKPSLLKLDKEADSAFISSMKSATGHEGKSKKGGDDDDDDDESDTEHFDDIHGSDSDDEPTNPDQKLKKDSKKTASSWLHRKNNKTDKSSGRYDTEARNPMFANADKTLHYELVLLANHYHPSVALFARTLLDSEPVSYGGDPLADFTLMRFLDRFSYRNPKESKANKQKEAADHGEDADEIDPDAAGGDDKNAVRMSIGRKKKRVSKIKMLGVMSDEYLNTKKMDVPVDERFLHTYMKTFEPKRKRKGDDESDVESVASDEADAMIQQFEPGDANKDFFDVDFSSEFNPGIIKRNKRKKGDDESESGEEDEDFEYSDDDEDLMADMKSNKKKNKKGRSEADLVYDADQFGEMLEDTAEAARVEEKESKRNKRGHRIYQKLQKKKRKT